MLLCYCPASCNCQFTHIQTITGPVERVFVFGLSDLPRNSIVFSLSQVIRFRFLMAARRKKKCVCVSAHLLRNACSKNEQGYLWYNPGKIQEMSCLNIYYYAELSSVKIWAAVISSSLNSCLDMSLIQDQYPSVSIGCVCVCVRV